MIEIDSLTGGYRDRTIFSSFSAVFESGKFTAVLGPNGSGKTTLLKFLVKELIPESGTVLVDGTPISELRQKELARRIAFVPQNTSSSMPLTVYELVSLSRYSLSGNRTSFSDADTEAIEKALQLTDIEAFRNRPFSCLSGGERQRVLIARALAQETPYILLDEPISALDPKYALEILTILSAAVKNEGKSIVCILHTLDAALSFADNVLLLKDGQNKGSGEASVLLTESSLSAVYDTPVKIEKLSDGKSLARIFL